MTQAAVAAALAGGFVGYLLGKEERPPTEADIATYLREAKPTLIRTLRIDTATERSVDLYPMPGQAIYVKNPEVPTQPVYIRLNEPDAAELEITELRKIKSPFYRFYISNAAGAGVLELEIHKTKATDLAESQMNVNITATTAIVDINVVASAVMMPVDIQGAYIMMPVDIQAQYMNLEIDIVAQSVGHIEIDIAAQSVGNIDINIAAQTANLDINIAAAAVTLDINIASQAASLNVNIAATNVTLDVEVQNASITVTATNLSIKIDAQAVGVYLQPEWAAKERKDKNFSFMAMNLAVGATGNAYYTVPADKDLYLCGFSFEIYATNNADKNNNQIGAISLYNLDTTTTLAWLGGNGGGGVVFAKPILVPEGEQLRYSWSNRSNHVASGYVTVWGYEVDV